MNKSAKFTSTNVSKLYDRTLAYRWKIGNMYSNSDFSKNMLSHFFESVTALKRDSAFLETQVCQKCFAVFLSSNHITRFNPKKRVTKRYAKALKKMAQSGEIQRKYKKRGLKLLQSRSTMNIKCLLCGYTNALKGASYSKLIEKKSSASTQKTKRKQDSRKSRSSGSNLYALIQKKDSAAKSVSSQLQSFLDSL